MIKELEEAWQQRSKGEADLSDIYERFSRATQSCRQVVTKRVTIITSLVEYHEQWQLVSEWALFGLLWLHVVTILVWFKTNALCNN